MTRICTLSLLSLILYFLMWSAKTKGSHNDQTDNLGSKDNLLKRQRRDEQKSFYDIKIYVNQPEVACLWKEWRKFPRKHFFVDRTPISENIRLPFDFPFFGQNIRNIEVTSNGFISTKHYWQGQDTQYIAPYMIGFDLGNSQDAHIYVVENGTAVTVVWRNFVKIDKKFTFSATLHRNGEIVFVYYNAPPIHVRIYGRLFPDVVGLSTAYVLKSDWVKRVYARFDKELIKDNTIVRLKPFPSCQAFKDYQSCLHQDISLKCTWCMAVNRCSSRDGLDSGMYQWHKNDCEIDALGIGDPVPEDPSSSTAVPEDPSSSTALSTDATGYYDGTDLTDYQPDESSTYDWRDLYKDFYIVPAEEDGWNVPESTPYESLETYTSEDTTTSDHTNNQINTIRQCVQQCF